MKIAVLSGKGGTGKTFVAVNLAATAPKALYVDADVEAPNGHLFLKPEGIERTLVEKILPVFDAARCTKCRACVDFCHFNALALVGETPMVFDDVCHSCGGCVRVCPADAIKETGVEIGHIDHGYSGSVEVASGFLNIGEASGVGVIRALVKMTECHEEPVVIDCPPGSACSVVESIAQADYCILVAEPTLFGLDNFRMVQELVTIMGKPYGVIINKATDEESIMDRLCADEGLELLACISFSRQTAGDGARGMIASQSDATLAETFRGIWRRLEEVGA